MIRLTTVMWFAVFMRRETARGAFVTAVKKGAQQAGAIFIVHNHLDGTGSLYSPAPQPLVDDTLSERFFELVLEKVPQTEIDLYLEKQKRFDPDLWIIETESGSGNPSVELVEP